MNAQHTQGLMVVNPIQLDQIATADASKGIARVTHFGHSVDTVIANARRLAACWNFCEGLDTEGMEMAVEIGRPATVTINDATKKELELQAQRDELLKELKHIAVMTNDGYAERHAREAIAQATGGQP